MKFRTLIFLLFFAILQGCKPDPKPDDDNKDTFDLTIRFEPIYWGNPLSWTSYYLTTSQDTIKFDNVKYIISNFVLEKQNGELLEIKDAFGYISLKSGRNSVVLNNVPKGDYKSIRFKVGLDSAINHGDPAVYDMNHPLSPAVNGMHWGWTGGYIFNVIEGYYKSNGKEEAFSFHVATLKNARVHSFVVDYSINANASFVFNVQLEKYFSNFVNYSLKNDGSYSHSGDPDPVMDKFMQNAIGVLEFNSFQ